jgi:hypothetical protein
MLLSCLCFANNINQYTETNLVPMPKGNLLFECNITLDRQSQSKPKVPDYRKTFYIFDI